MNIFFRKIRKRLIGQKRLNKYLIYAVGEIFLVVIGILIALSINNWNSARKDRQREAVLLNQIHRDFSSNKLQLDSILAFHRQKILKTQELIALMTTAGDSSIIEYMLKGANDIVGVKTFNPQNGSVDALINSSTFELVSNDSLRGLLVSWRGIYADFNEEQQSATRYMTDHFLPFFRKQFDYLNPYAKGNLDLIRSIEFQNIWFDSQIQSQFILDAAKDEKVEVYINDIIKLTSTYD